MFLLNLRSFHWDVLKSETAKRNDRNETSETTKTTKTTATKQPKRPKRNDRNETTVTTKTNHYNNREERTMKFRGKCTFHIRYSLAFKKIILCNLVSEANPSRWQSRDNYVFPKGRSVVNYNRNEMNI